MGRHRSVGRLVRCDDIHVYDGRGTCGTDVRIPSWKDREHHSHDPGVKQSASFTMVLTITWSLHFPKTSSNLYHARH